MAEIPIEKKRSGIPAWLWLLLAVVVAGILLWLVVGREDDRLPETPVATAPYAPAAGGMNGADGSAATSRAADGPITDLATLLAGPDEAVVGREVRLSNVAAGEVPADAGFWITGANGAREYVVLHEVRTPNTPIEGRVDVDKGDRVDIVGTVRPASAGAPEGAAIPGPTAPLPDGISHYIDATRVTKAS